MKNINIILPTIQEAWIDTGLGNWLNIIMENNGKININNWFRFNNIVKGDFKPPLVSNLYVVNVMDSMFYNRTALTSLDLSSWDTSNVTNMSFMFYYCTSLTSLDLSSWDTSKVTNMSGMFQCCKEITKLDLSSWNVSNVNNMENMFFKCSRLISLNLSLWNVNNVSDMFWMFYGCNSLQEIKCTKATKDKILSFSDNGLPKDFKGWKII